MGLLIRNLIYILPVVQCLCAIHVYRTGRPNYWFYVILIFPGIGSLAYILTEILPGVRWDRIEIDIPNRSVRLAVPDAELDQRRSAMLAKGDQAWKPGHRERKVTTALRAYAAMTTSASRGAVRVVRD